MVYNFIHPSSVKMYDRIHANIIIYFNQSLILRIFLPSIIFISAAFFNFVAL